MSEYDKSQSVRLIDVFMLGPLMIAAGARESTLPAWMRIGLVTTGVATVGYNLNNFVGNRRREEEAGELSADELVRGTIHEFEHTDDFDTAKQIALDHLARDPRYYSKLEECGL